MRPSKSIIRSIVILALVGAGLSSAVVAVAQNGDSAPVGAQNVATNATEDPSAAAAPKSSRPARLFARFGALRGARTARDVMPADIARAQGTHNGENVALSQLATQTASGTRYYLVPATDTVCLLSDEGAGGCAAPGDAAEGDFTIVVCAPDLPAGHVRILGLLPDGVKRIQVRAENGATATFGVTNNVVVADVPTTTSLDPVAVDWTDPAGRSQEEDIDGPWGPPGACA